MPLIYQHRIYRYDLVNNPKVLYVFGDNVKRMGMGGQAAEMRGEPNAVGVATKYLPSMAPDAFFTDERLVEQQKIIAYDLVRIIQHVKAGGVAIWPLDGIGTGLSRMPELAPKTWAYLERCRNHIAEAAKQ